MDRPPPSSPDPLDELVERYLMGDTSVEDVCKDAPHLGPVLRRRVALLDRFGFLEAPERLGAYRLERRLGGGGMGIVHLATDERTGESVALKRLSAARVDSPASMERFDREIQAVANLQHPGIVALREAGCSGATPFFTMEYVESVSLADVLDALRGRDPATLTGADLTATFDRVLPTANPQLPDPHADRSWVDVCLHLVRQVAEALEHAHRRGIVHRDVKPSNILCTRTGHTILIDFGLALSAMDRPLTQTGSPVGSFPYMSPEQWTRPRDALDHRTDVYSLGVVLYELLTLTPAFDGTSSEAIRRHVLFGAATSPRHHNPALPRPAETVCLQAMARDPRDRYRTAGDLARDLGRVLEAEPIEGRRPGYLARLRRLRARHPAAAAAAVVAAILATVGLAAFGLQERWSREQLQDVQRRHERDSKWLLDQLGETLCELRPQTSDTARFDATLAKLLEEAREDADADTDGSRYRLAQTLGVVGRIHRLSGDYERGYAMLREGVALLRATKDRDPVHLAGLLMFYGECAAAVGHGEDAESALREAVAAFAASPIARPAERAVAHDELAAMLHRAGDLDAAARHFATALESHAASVGRAHPWYVATRARQGLLLLDLDRHAEAQRAFEEACEASRHDASIGHRQNLIRSYHGLGRTCERRGDVDRALGFYRQATRVDASGLSPDFQAGAWYDLGLLLSDAGPLTAAVAPLRRALTAYRSTLGPRHRHTAITAYCLGKILMRLGRHADALPEFAAAATFFDRPGRAATTWLANLRHWEAVAQTATGALETGCQGFAAALAVRAEIDAADHPHAHRTTSCLGAALARLGHPAEAARRLQAGWRGLVRTLGEDHRETRRAADRLQEFRRRQAGAPAIVEAAHK